MSLTGENTVQHKATQCTSSAGCQEYYLSIDQEVDYEHFFPFLASAGCIKPIICLSILRSSPAQHLIYVRVRTEPSLDISMFRIDKY